MGHMSHTKQDEFRIYQHLKYQYRIFGYTCVYKDLTSSTLIFVH